MHRRDIPDKLILFACQQYHRGVAPTPEIALNGLYPAKLILSKMERLVEQDMIEYGVSLRTAWVTQKGRDALGVDPRGLMDDGGAE